MAVTVGTVHRRATKGNQQTSGSRAAGGITLPLPPLEGYRLVTAAAEAIPRAEFKEEDQDTGRVRLAVGPSWKSWGERVVLDVSADQDKTEVAVTSRSAFPLTVVDYGKNRDNVDRIVTWLERESTAGAPGSQ